MSSWPAALTLVLVGVSSGSSALAQSSEAERSQEERSEVAAGSSTSTERLQEIVITATRREEELSKVALSVTAYNSETLDKQGARNIDDISRLVPGLSFTRSAGGNSSQSNITIRGIQSTSGVPTTGVYIDDTPVQIRVGSSQSLVNPYPLIFDLDRVEVLRGPQGTLFGSGAIGGAVRFITPEPNLRKTSSYVRTEAAFTESGSPSYELGGAFGTPIIQDQLGFRASVWHRHDGGYVDMHDPLTGALLDRNTNSEDETAARLAIGWKPTESLTITPSFFYQMTHTYDAPAFALADSDIERGEFRTNTAFVKQPNTDRFYLPAMKIELEMGKAILISNSSYLSRSVSNRSDDTALSLAFFGGGYTGPFPQELASYRSGSTLDNSEETLTQEIRLQSNDPDSKLTWVTGLFYSRNRTRDLYFASDPNLVDVINFGLAQQGIPPVDSVQDVFGVGLYQNRYNLYLDTTSIDTQKAVFAQADYNVTTRLKLTAGLRYTRAAYSSGGFGAGAVISSTGDTTRLSEENRPFTPKFGVAYQADDDNLVYANAAKGFRMGGATDAVGTRCAEDAAAIGFNPLVERPIQPDSAWSYEVGSKNKVLDQRVSLDAAAYLIKWSNVQTLLGLPTCGIPTTINMGDARSTGVDLALSARVLEGLSLGLAVGYNHSTYTTDFPGPNNVILRRRGEPLGVPPWTVYLNGQYDLALNASLDGYVRADYSYSSHDSTPLYTQSPLVDPDIPRAPSTSELSLRIGAIYAGWDVSLFVENALNAHPLLGEYHNLVGTQDFHAITFRPRTIGVTMMLRK